MKIYGIIFDGGDGSASISWYDKENSDKVLSDDYYNFDAVQMNEGDPVVTLNLPNDIKPEDIGITLSEV